MRIEWQERAACQGEPTELFFPARGMRQKDCYAEAREICEGCPVRWECLDQALRTEQQSFRVGMFGGLSPRERDAWAKFTRRNKRRLAAL